MESLEVKASNLAVGSGSGLQDYSAEYTQLEERLNDVKKAIKNNLTDATLRSINERIKNLE